MAAKELKALIDVGTSLGYSGDELKQFINDERMRMDREKEEKEKLAKEDKERERVEKEKERERVFELEKLKLQTQEKERETQAQEKERTEKLKFEEAEREKERAFELEKIKLEQEVEVQKIRSEHELKLAEVQGVQREQTDNGEGNGAEDNPRQNNGSRSVAMKALKLPPFNEDKDDLDAYLTRFERACTAFDARPEFWST